MSERHDLPHRRRSQRLERAGDRRLAIEHVRDEHLRCELFFTQLLAEFERLDVIKKFDHFFVGSVAERAEKGRSEKFPPAFAAVEIDVEQIARIELHFDPRTAVRNDPETIEHFAVEMDARFKRDSRRTMQLADHDALGAVDHERALRRHERDLAHVNFFFLRPFLLAELESDMERRAERLAFALCLERRQFRFADFVVAEIERRFFIVALDRKHFLEDRLEAGILPLGKRHVFLEEIDVGIELNLDEVWRLDAFLDGSEVDTFRHNGNIRDC